GVGIQPVSEAAETNVEDVIPRRQEKQKFVIVDSDEPSYHAKKLRKDHGIPVGTSVAGKSMSAIQRLLAGAVQNAAVRGEPDPSLPFVTSSMSTKSEQLFVISSDSSHHSGTHIAETKADSLIRSSAPAMTTATTVTVTAGATTVVKETLVKPSLFATGSSSVGGTEPIPGGFSDLTGSEFLVGDIRTVIDPDSDLQKVYVPRWNVTNGSRLDDNRDCREMVDEFAPSKFFASIRGTKHDQLFAEFNVGAALQMTLSAEVRMRAEYNIKEKRRLKSFVDDQAEVLKASKFEAAEKSLQDEIRSLKERNAVTPPDGAWTEYVSEGVTSSYFEHKA
ncbi:hypothetical protein Tco_0021233, partial [Tanacetum coccineum]